MTQWLLFGFMCQKADCINLISEKGDTFLHGCITLKLYFKFTSVMRTISSLQMSG